MPALLEFYEVHAVENQTTLAEVIRPKNPNLVDEREAAEMLGVSPGTLSVWRSTGRYALPFIKVGRNVRYRKSDLDAWLEAQTRTSGAAA